MVCVSWNDAQAYIDWLNRTTGKGYRLPTEAEWEYACRSGGRTQEYCGGDDLEPLAWYEDNGGGRSHPVGSKVANGLGLHDMSGNVSERVEDCWNQSYVGAPADGGPWLRGDCGRSVFRGGGWSFVPHGVRSVYRFWYRRDFRDNGSGFRLARDR